MPVVRTTGYWYTPRITLLEGTRTKFPRPVSKRADEVAIPEHVTFFLLQVLRFFFSVIFSIDFQKIAIMFDISLRTPGPEQGQPPVSILCFVGANPVSRMWFSEPGARTWPKALRLGWGFYREEGLQFRVKVRLQVLNPKP